MDIRCGNCGQTAVAGDINCWHCGRRLPVAQPSPANGATTRAKVREQWELPASLPDAAVYIGMTAVVILGFFLVLASLGRNPLVQNRVGQGLPDGWSYYADNRRTLTLALPDGWQVWQGEEAARQVDGNNLYRQALGPFGEQADDLSPRLVALAPPREDGEVAMFAVVAQSDALGRLSAEQAVTLAERSPELLEAEFRSNFERSGVFLSVERPEADPPLRCWQYLTGGDNGRETMLLSLCAPSGRFGIYQETMATILENFEVLRRE